MTTPPPGVPPSRSAPIIERAPLPLVEVQGKTHVVTHVNAAFCSLMGRPRSELIGRSFEQIVPSGEACVPLLDQVFETGDAVTYEQESGDDDSSTSWLYAIWPALDPDEHPVGVIIGMTKITASRRDLTAMNEALLLSGMRQQESKEVAQLLNAKLQGEIAERERAEQALRQALELQAAADRNKDEFLAMLAHELRNPLAPIKNAAHILRTARGDNAMVTRAQEIVERQADHLARLVDELLDVSRIQKGKVRLQREHLDLNQVISRAVESCEDLIRAQGHTITLELEAIPPLEIDADPTRAEQILVNLISNAAKYTRRRGAIHVSAAREDGMAVVRVRDNGLGLAPDMLQQVFELFTQVAHSLERSQGGLGLGLKLVKELVELHGGSVEARSEGLGKGSEFVVRLPAVAHVDQVVAPQVPALAMTRRRILVVDDSADNRETMEMLLTLDGHIVEVAEDGEEGVAKALRGHPDVAFVDIGLPKLNGYEVAKAIRGQPGADAIVLIALSGYGQDEDKREALAAGFDAHLTKPVNSAGFNKVLSNLETFRQARRG